MSFWNWNSNLEVQFLNSILWKKLKCFSKNFLGFKIERQISFAQGNQWWSSVKEVPIHWNSERLAFTSQWTSIQPNCSRQIVCGLFPNGSPDSGVLNVALKFRNFECGSLPVFCGQLMDFIFSLSGILLIKKFIDSTLGARCDGPLWLIGQSHC